MDSKISCLIVKNFLFFEKQVADCGKVVKNAHAENQNADHVQIYAHQKTGITYECGHNGVGKKAGNKHKVIVFAFHTGANAAKNGIQRRHQRYGKKPAVFKR